MNFFDSTNHFYFRFADYGGRSSRSAYWWAVIWCVACLLTGLIFALGGSNYQPSTVAFGGAGGGLLSPALISLVNLIPGIALVVRRLHDIGKSGHWIWFGLIPVIGQSYLVLELTRRSNAGPNQWGITDK